MPNIMMRFLVVVGVLLAAGRVFADSDTEHPPAAGKVTYVRGEVVSVVDDEEKALALGDELSAGQVLRTGADAKVKFLLDGPKSLVCVSSGTSVEVGLEGVEVIEGDKDNILIKNMDFLKSSSALGSNSRKVSGSYVLRGESEEIRLLNLTNGTATLDPRPVFQWSGEQSGAYLVRLFEYGGPGDKEKLWEKQTSGTSLSWPEGEKPLTAGKYYLWEVIDLFQNDMKAEAFGMFYSLGGEERKEFAKQMDKLDELAGDEEMDSMTLDYLRIELLELYNLRDGLKDYLIETLGRHPSNGDFKQRLKSL